MSETIVEELKAAASAVEEASLPEQLRPVAFTAAFWAGRGQALPAAATTAPKTKPRSGPAAPAPAATPSSPEDRGGLIARKLGVSLDDVEFIYELEGDAGDLGLRVPPGVLDSGLKGAVTQIVYLVAAARQAAGIEDRTLTKSIKAVCQDRGKVDSNFGRIVDGLHGSGVSVAGSGHARSVRVNAVGFEKATALIKKFVEPDS